MNLYVENYFRKLKFFIFLTVILFYHYTYNENSTAAYKTCLGSLGYPRYFYELHPSRPIADIFMCNSDRSAQVFPDKFCSSKRIPNVTEHDYKIRIEVRLLNCKI